MEETETSLQPGMVKKRISEMASKFENNSVKRSNSNNNSSNNNNSQNVSNFYTPKPFKARSATDGHEPFVPHKFKSSFGSTNNNYNSDNKKLATESPKPELPPRSTTESNKRPVLPPKPRNISFKSTRNNSNNNNDNDNDKNGNVMEISDCDAISRVSESSDCITDLVTRKSKSVIYPNDRNELLERRRSCTEFQDLIQKKGEIRDRIMQKIVILREERELLVEEKKEFERNVQNLVNKLDKKATDSDVHKVNQFLQEIDQVTKLFLSLNIRMSKAKNMLERNDLSSREKQNYNDRLKRLEEQIIEAKSLEENAERRRKSIKSQILQKHLTPEENENFEQEVKDLVKKVRELKELDNKIKSGEEQLVALNGHTTLDSLSEL